MEEIKETKETKKSQSKFIQITNYYGYIEFFNRDKVTMVRRAKYADTYIIYFDNHEQLEIPYQEFLRIQHLFY